MILLVIKYFSNKRYRGITIYPFVIVTKKQDEANFVLLNHEKIHIRQQLELLIFLFFIWYGLEFLIRYLKYRNWSLAYRNICFEREAYGNEKDLNYLKKRSFWRWVKYL